MLGFTSVTGRKSSPLTVVPVRRRGYFDTDGHFYFKGRLGEQIKSSGMK